MPAGQARDIIFADQNEKLRGWLAFAEGCHGVDRVGRRWPLQLHPIESKKRLAFNRSAQHFQTNVSCCRLPIQLVRGEGGRDENQCLELQLLGGIAREEQVSVMNRIEGAAEDTNLFQNVTLLCCHSERSRGISRYPNRHS